MIYVSVSKRERRVAYVLVSSSPGEEGVAYMFLSILVLVKEYVMFIFIALKNIYYIIILLHCL